MRKFLLSFHRRKIVPAVKSCESRLIIPLAVMIGILAALATSAMHALVMLPSDWALSWHPRVMAGEWRYRALFVLLPLAGLTISFLIQHFWGGPRYAKSLSPLILALNRHRSSIPLKECVTHIYYVAMTDISIW